MEPTHPNQAEMHPATGRTPRRWEIVRVLFGVIYLLGALAHVVLGLFAPAVYEQFADQALVGAYTDLWRSLVIPNLATLQPLVTVFEFGLVVALLWRGRAVRVGHAAGAAFQFGLILSGPWGPINALLGAIHVAALRVPYPASVVEIVQRRRTDRQSRESQPRRPESG